MRQCSGVDAPRLHAWQFGRVELGGPTVDNDAVSSMPAPPGTDLLAAVDIGSNSFRVEIGRIVGGRYRRVEYLKQTVRLGAGLDERGCLTEAAAQRGLQCLQEFAAHLKGLPPARVRAVATLTHKSGLSLGSRVVRSLRTPR